MTAGSDPECSVFGLLSCCRNEHITDGPTNLPQTGFKGGIVFGVRSGDAQNSESTLAQQLREHLQIIHAHKGNNESSTIWLPSDLMHPEHYWHINEGDGRLFPAIPFKVEYYPN